MISTRMRLFVFVVMFVSSTSLAKNENDVPSTITIKENYNSPAILSPMSPYGPPPIVSNFVHQGTNFFFNPQFLLGTNIPSLIGAVVAATKPSEQDTPNEEVVVPEIISPPKIIIEKPIEVILPPPPPPLIPVNPVVPELPTPVLLEVIPPAPVLPPLELPKIPIWIEESVKVAPPCYDQEIVITEFKPVPPIIIPRAPFLPPLVLPPKIIVSEMEVKSQPPVEPSIIDVAIVPERELSMSYSKVKLTDEESYQIMSAPRSDISEIDFKNNEISDTIEFLDIIKLASSDEDKTVFKMLPSPEFPVIEIPKPISEVLLIEKDKELGSIIAIPTDCARNIVLERVLPNIISKKTITKSLEVISFPAAQYPVINL